MHHESPNGVGPRLIPHRGAPSAAPTPPPPTPPVVPSAEPTCDLLLAKLGDKAAFARFVCRSTPFLLNNALRPIRGQAAQDDVLQETFLVVWRRISRFDPEQYAVGLNPTSDDYARLALGWVNQIAWGVLRAHFRSVGRTKEQPNSAPLEQQPDRRAPERDIDIVADLACLQSAVAKVDSRAWPIYQLRLADMSWDEIAAKVGMTAECARQIFCRTNKKLREQFGSKKEDLS